ncbi:MAG: aconitate hydratase AcnA, partial [Desulfobacterales bacterium]|nr:aconitate hydratase AcnA [Desulfobacterales bacterium]
YLKKTNRPKTADFVEAYAKATGFFNTHEEEPVFSKLVEVDLGAIDTSVAGPSRPQDRIPLGRVKEETSRIFDFKSNAPTVAPETKTGKDDPELTDGSVVIAAITSCTNTSNPYIMIGAGLVAKNAAEKGLTVPWYVKTSLSPGSRVVLDYLTESGLMDSFEKLGGNNTGFGCMTCIGNSGPLDPYIEKAIKEHDLDVMSVLSGNRNFEARIHQQVKGNFLMSPILVVIYALAGRVDIDLEKDPLGHDAQGNPVFMKDIWPDTDTINQFVETHVHQRFFQDQYAQIFKGDKLWQELEVNESTTFEFDADSTYIRNPPYFEGFSPDAGEIKDIQDARPLLVLGDSVTTDHISPAGAIPEEYPAGQYLVENGIQPWDFNSYGSRRGNHEVMMRGTFANIRIKNTLVDETGGLTLKFPEKTQSYVFNVADAYAKDRTDLVVFGGKEYGTGSSRDWAAKGTCLLGVKAVIAESFERIHRSNLVGMGVLPLTFLPGENAASLGITGEETFTIDDLDRISPNKHIPVTMKKDGTETRFNVVVKLNTDIETEYIRNKGILHYVLRQMIQS